ncbi:hypothetical protein WISP_19548 [Willisornis vidua]|uniref:Uncharacterized protein n=1 Tax=Willisornis vidua TaxID=1566151 RepID=A0ABQ9DPE1_9PASS|nr:hypothetical protein WISP_19548 [Willisornis vidua]
MTEKNCLKFKKGKYKRNNPRHQCRLKAELLESSSEEKDLKVLVDNNTVCEPAVCPGSQMGFWGSLGRAFPAGEAPKRNRDGQIDRVDETFMVMDRGIVTEPLT